MYIVTLKSKSSFVSRVTTEYCNIMSNSDKNIPWQGGTYGYYVIDGHEINCTMPYLSHACYLEGFKAIAYFCNTYYVFVCKTEDDYIKLLFLVND